MQTCNKCGSIIPFVGGNCPKCGRDDGSANASAAGRPNVPSPFGTFGTFGAVNNSAAAGNSGATNPFVSFGASNAPKTSDDSEPEEKPSAPETTEKPNKNNPFGSFGAANPSAAERSDVNSPFKAFAASKAPVAEEPAKATNPYAAFGAFGKFGAAPNNNANNNTTTPFGSATAEKLSKNSLIRDLKEYKELLGETADLKSMIKPQSEFPKTDEQMYKKRSFIKYFWPFVVAAPAAGYLIYIVSYLIMMSSVKAKAEMNLDEQAARAAVTSIMGDLMGGIAVAVIVAAAIIIFGIVTCRRKQTEFNSNADYMNGMISERYQKGLENQRMIDLYQEDLTKMHKYELIVPKEYQNFSSVGRMIELLEEDRATTIEGCCDIIKLESLS